MKEPNKPNSMVRSVTEVHKRGRRVLHAEAHISISVELTDVVPLVTKFHYKYAALIFYLRKSAQGGLV